VRNPRRNILLATVLVCLLTGIIAAAEVYVSQLVWGKWGDFPDLDTAFCICSAKSRRQFLFHVVNISLLVSCMGAGIGSMLGASRLLYGMGREDALLRSFLVRIDPKTFYTRNNVLFIGAITLAGVFILNSS